MVAYKAKKLTPIKTSTLQDLGVSVINLSKYTEDEFHQVAKSLQATDPDPVLHVAPTKPRVGITVNADGTNWNPGNGAGPYYYDGSTWQPLTQVPVTVPGPATVVPLMDGVGAVGTSLLYARQDHVHPTDTSRMATAGNQNITGGFTFTPYSQATGSFTVNALNGNYQYTTNNGAFTITAPTTDCAVDLLVTNGASAGAITFSGFTVGSNTGDALDTTNTHKFIISVRRINGTSTYVVKALQ